MNYITRTFYIDKVKPFIDTDLIKVVVGQRRVGKSFFLVQIAELIKTTQKEANIVAINKEDLQFDSIKNYLDLVNYCDNLRVENQKNYLFIDEIQDIREFEKALRHFQTSGKWDIYCTGSNARMLSGELATFLSGRYIEIRMFSLSYTEFLEFHNLPDTSQTLTQYLKYGGLPYLRNLELSDTIVYEYLKNIYSTILFKDIIARHNVRNVAFLERLVLFVADNIGNIVSAKKISDYLKSQHLNFSHNVVLDYLNFLGSAFFLFQVKRNDLKGKRILEIGEKYYFEDLGIRQAICAYRPNDIGQVLENAVFIHLLRQNYTVTVGKWEEQEIDFVCEKSQHRIYVQVTLSLAEESTRQREFGNLLKIKDNFRKIVVTADEYTLETYQGIECTNIRTFLKSDL